MNVKKYRAADSDQAMRMIRLAHGVDVAILDCYSVPGGVEVVVSLDDLPDSNPAPASFSAQLNTLTGKRDSAPAGVDDFDSPLIRSREQVAARQAAETEAPAPRLAWSQDEELLTMKRELAAMKSMLLDQLKGQDWQQADQRAPQQRGLNRFMAAMDIDPELAKRLAAEIPEAEDERLQREMFKALLTAKTPIMAPPQSGAICLVGPQGSGKTTSIAKLAAQYVMRHGRKDIAVLTTDMARVGAQEQLCAYGRILQIPIHTVVSVSEAIKTFRMLQSKSLVLVDTAGISFRDKAGLKEQENLLAGMPGLQVFLSLPADVESYVQSEIIDAYAGLSPLGAVITRIDESMRLGAVLSNLILHRLPAVWCTNGPRVPQNLSPADAGKLVNMAVKMARAFEVGKDRARPTEPTKPRTGGAVSVLG
jgi:flagellar biosynthesis protein FlhF